MTQGILAALMLAVLAACATPSSGGFFQTPITERSFSAGGTTVKVAGLFGEGVRDWPAANIKLTVPLDPLTTLVEAGESVLRDRPDLFGNGVVVDVPLAAFSYGFDIQAVGSIPVADYGGQVVVTADDGSTLFSGQISAQARGERAPPRINAKVQATAEDAARAFWNDFVGQWESTKRDGSGM